MKQLIGRVLVVMVCLAPLTVSAADNSSFNKLDSDQSGHLSRDELLKSDLVTVKGADGKDRIAHRDMVKDGQAAVLTADQKHRLFESLDTDKSGYISRKEWSRASPDGFVLWRF